MTALIRLWLRGAFIIIPIVFIMALIKNPQIIPSVVLNIAAIVAIAFAIVVGPVFVAAISLGAMSDSDKWKEWGDK